MDNKTGFLKLPLPDPNNPLQMDVHRLIESLRILDACAEDLKAEVSALDADTQRRLTALLDSVGLTLLDFQQSVNGSIENVRQTAAAAETPAGAQAKAEAACEAAMAEIDEAIGGQIMTQMEYDALSDDDKMDGAPRHIYDDDMVIKKVMHLGQEYVYNVGSEGSGVYNTREALTTSGTYIASVTGWYKVTCIGGGGAGGNGYTSNSKSSDHPFKGWFGRSPL